MSTSDSDDTLACGRAADDIVDQVADGRSDQRDSHQAHCPHCQAALAEYERLWAPLRGLAAEKITAPDSVLDVALARVRGAVSHFDYGVLESPDGVTRISARVVVVAARESAQRVPGVRVALSKHVGARPVDNTDAPADATTPGSAEVTAGVAGRSTAIEIILAAEYGQNLHVLAERVRTEVDDRVRALTDLEPVEITVIVDDVLD